jgi:hypothetical protein
MKIRHIQIDSSFRDRSQYPLQSNFKVDINAPRNSNALVARDPLFSSTMVYPNYMNYTDVYDPFGYLINMDPSLYAQNVVTILPVYSKQYFNRVSFSTQLEQQTIELVQSVRGGAVVESNSFRTIIKSRPTTVFYTDAISAIASNPTTIRLVNFNTLTSTNNNIDDFFSGWKFETENESGIVLHQRGYYDPLFLSSFEFYLSVPITVSVGSPITFSTDSYMLTLDKPFATVMDDLLSSSSLDNFNQYRIHKKGILPLFPAIPLQPGVDYTTFELLSTPSNVNLVGQMLWITDPNVVVSDTTLVGSTANTVLIPFGVEFPVTFFVGMTFQITDPLSVVYNQMYQIIAWDPTSQQITIMGEFGCPVGDVDLRSFRIFQKQANEYRLITKIQQSFPNDTLYVNKAFSTKTVNGLDVPFTITPSLDYQILLYSDDNCNSINCIESSVGQQQLVCWKVMLVGLTLPTCQLVTGGTILSYPYVYVKFEGTQTGIGATPLYSNNPNCRNALFYVPVHGDLIEENYVVLSCTDVWQMVKYTMNDSFEFSVYLPNGKLFEPTISDTCSPMNSNPKLQISACFVIDYV